MKSHEKSLWLISEFQKLLDNEELEQISQQDTVELLCCESWNKHITFYSCLFFSSNY